MRGLLERGLAVSGGILLAAVVLAGTGPLGPATCLVSGLVTGVGAWGIWTLRHREAGPKR